MEKKKYFAPVSQVMFSVEMSSHLLAGSGGENGFFNFGGGGSPLQPGSGGGSGSADAKSGQDEIYW